jgi:hypothetical protein
VVGERPVNRFRGRSAGARRRAREISRGLAGRERARSAPFAPPPGEYFVSAREQSHRRKSVRSRRLAGGASSAGGARPRSRWRANAAIGRRLVPGCKITHFGAPGGSAVGLRAGTPAGLPMRPARPPSGAAPRRPAPVGCAVPFDHLERRPVARLLEQEQEPARSTKCARDTFWSLRRTAADCSSAQSVDRAAALSPAL